MYTVSVDKECGCFRRSDLINNINLENKDDALIKAIDMSNTMNDDFCGKHEFQVSEKNNNFIISMKHQEVPAQKSGCCGGGCGHH